MMLLQLKKEVKIKSLSLHKYDNFDGLQYPRLEPKTSKPAASRTPSRTGAYIKQ